MKQLTQKDIETQKEILDEETSTEFHNRIDEYAAKAEMEMYGLG